MDSEDHTSLVGGFLNAKVRGESMDATRQSFLNAGYAPQLVDSAYREAIGQGGGMVVNEGNVSTGNAPVGQPKSMPVASGQQTVGSGKSGMDQSNVQNSGLSWWVVLLLVLLAFGVIVLAGVLGVYWNTLFG